MKVDSKIILWSYIDKFILVFFRLVGIVGWGVLGLLLIGWLNKR